MILAQEGSLYRLQNGTFTALKLPGTGTWLQPTPVPGTHNFVAVLRGDAWSDLYLISDDGSSVSQLTHNQTQSTTIQFNHWMFYPHVAADGNTIYVSYDAPKSVQSYEIEFAIWRGQLNGSITDVQMTSPNSYTGGDVQPVTLPNGSLIYSKFTIGNDQLYSQIALQASAQSDPQLLTSFDDDCGQPALSPDGTQLAMICIGGTSGQSSKLEVASLTSAGLGPLRVLTQDCLCASPSWAPDGSGLVYWAPADATGHFQMWWIAGAAGTAPKAPRQVTSNDDFDATSPAAWTSS
jgi:Tol biopolymer transport system component